MDMEARIRNIIGSWGLSRFSSNMALVWIKKIVSNDTIHDDRFNCFRSWLMQELNNQRIPEFTNHWQIGCPELLPNLTASPIWNCKQFSWINCLEKAYPTIKQELLGLRSVSGFQPYRAPTRNGTMSDNFGSLAHEGGEWNVFYLFLHNMDFSANRKYCPRTVDLITSIENQYEHAFFSVLAPKTHIMKHHGPTNKKLRCHLPLIVPEGKCRLRVGDEVHTLVEGKCFIFDDSFEHEAWNDDEHHSRIVLIVDIWHPSLSMDEIKFFTFLRNAQLNMAKKQYREFKDNFFSIIKEVNENCEVNHEAIWN